MDTTTDVNQPDLTEDARWMRRALELAEMGRGLVEPNPVVGAVIVKDGAVVGEGWHEKFGGPHAEIHALKNAGTKAAGATVYVTLEPCCHVGKTGPCTQALLAAKVARVSAAVLDPNPLVAGKGLMELRHHGVAVGVGVCAREARRINAPFFKFITQKRPYVIAKWAQSIDGAMADRFGESKWISCAASRQQVHLLRGRVDAVLVGIHTVIADDPLLTARPPSAIDIRRRALRCVLDTHCRLPSHSQLVHTAREIPVLLFHGRQLDAAALQRREQLSHAGIECVAIDGTGSDADGLNLGAVLDYLGSRSVSNLLVEGGSRLLGGLIKQRLVDEAQVYIAPIVVADHQARRIGTDGQAVHLAGAVRGTVLAHGQSGEDSRIIILFN